MQNLSQYPDLQDFGNLELLAKQVVEGFITGLHKSPFHGFSVEFAEHRAYNTGESVKNIDWKLFAKTDKFFVKQFEEETNLRCQIIIDTSSSMYYPKEGLSKLKFSVLASASLIYLLQKQRDAFGLTLFGNHIKLQTRAHSTQTHQKRLFIELEKILHEEKQTENTHIAQTLHEVAESLHKRSLIILFSDCMEQNSSNNQSEELFAAMRHLKYAKHEVIIFNTSDWHTEVDFNFDQRPHIFIDIETGEELKVLPNEVKENYLINVQQYRKNLSLKCAQYGIDLIDCDVKNGYRDILQAYLVKRTKMNT